MGKQRGQVLPGFGANDPNLQELLRQANATDLQGAVQVAKCEFKWHRNGLDSVSTVALPSPDGIVVHQFGGVSRLEAMTRALVSGPVGDRLSTGHISMEEVVEKAKKLVDEVDKKLTVK